MKYSYALALLGLVGCVVGNAETHERSDAGQDAKQISDGGVSAAPKQHASCPTGPVAEARDQPRKPDAGRVSELPTRYRLALMNRYGVRAMGAKGVACDGNSVWLVTDFSLEHARLESGEIYETITFRELGLMPQSTSGITLLDGQLYVALGESAMIVSIDPESRKIVTRFQSPGASDLEVSAGKLIASDSIGNASVIDPKTGAIRDRFAVGDTANRDYGIAVRDNVIFVGRMFGGMDVFDVSTGEELGHVTKGDGDEFLATEDVGTMCVNRGNVLILSKLGLSEYAVCDP